MADDDLIDRAFDERLRAAMKSVDATTPAGYFDSLASRILPRLEAPTMQTDSSGDHKEPGTDAALVAPPADDSGLHDIRSLADTAKKRLSKKVTAQPPTDDVLASSSGSWRNIALPEPAKMVSLPALAELPSAAEIKAKDKAAKAAAAAVVAAKKIEPAASASVSVPVGATVTAITVKRPAAQMPRKSNTRLIASVGAAFVAAAGVVLYISSQGGGANHRAADQASVASAPGAAQPAPSKVSADPIPTAPAPSPIAADITAAAGAAEPPPPAEPVANAVTTPNHAASNRKAAPTAGKAPAPKTDAVVVAPAAPVNETKGVAGATKPAPGDPSFDDLLKEAGVQDGVKKDAAPKLAKKSLSTSDITSGMGALASKAQACYKGTQGTAAVKLTVAPSGKVTKVTIGGAFASSPEGACVSAIVQGATFPPWDGGPQTVNYSYLISE